MKRTKGLKDVTASTKFLKALAGNNNVKVRFIPELKVPCACPSGVIHLPVPTIGDLDDWNYSAHHEVSHCFPEHEYHFDAMPIAHELKAGLLMNLIIDNLAERYEYERYEGRRRILSSGNYEQLKKLGPQLWTEPKNKNEELLKGLIAWDCKQRATWMGYPFSTYKVPEGQYQKVCDYLDRIGLERLMDEQSTTDDLIEILNLVLAYLQEEEEDDQDDMDEPGAGGSDQQDGGEVGQEDQEAGEASDNPTEDPRDDKQTTGEGESGEGSNETDSGCDPEGSDGSSDEGENEEPGPDVQGAESDESPGDGADAGEAGDGDPESEGSGGDAESVPGGSPGAEDPHGHRSGAGGDSDQVEGSMDSDQTSTDEVGAVPGGQDSPTEGGQQSPAQSECPVGTVGLGQRDEDEGEGQQDGDPQDNDQSPAEQGDTDSERFVLRPTEPFDGDNVAPETKEIVRELLMLADEEEPTQLMTDPYVPITDIVWKNLRRYPDQMDVKRLHSLIGGSKVSKSINKYLQAVNQTAYQYGTRTGRLSARSIYRSGNGGASIFKQKLSSRIEKDSAVTLLIDCSASMENGNSAAKYQIAFSCVAIMSETLTNLRIPHEILGFTERMVMAEPQVQMFEFKAYAETLRRTAMVDRLCSCPEMWNNHDAESILEAASRLNQRPEKNKLLIVLSDGNPVGHFYPSDYSAHEYLKEVCKHIEDDTSIDLFGIGIESSTVRHFYKDYQVVQKAEEMDEALMTLLRNKVIK